MEPRHLTQEQSDEFALGALEPDLERLFALHLAECGSCRAQVEAAEELASSLALSVPRRSPPAHLKRRVLFATGIVQPGPLGRAVRYAPAAAAVAAVFVAIAAFTGMVSVRSQVGDLRVANRGLESQVNDALAQKVQIAAISVRLNQEEQKSYDLRQQAFGDRDLLLALLSPDSYVAEVFGVDAASTSVGRLVWDEDQKRVWFVASDLPARPTGETYQIWVDSGGRYVSLGTFNSDTAGFARYDTIVPEGLTSYTSAVVTVERAGGAPERSGPSVFVGDFSRFKR